MFPGAPSLYLRAGLLQRVLILFYFLAGGFLRLFRGLLRANCPSFSLGDNLQ